jgi:hypothetical protein
MYGLGVCLPWVYFLLLNRIFNMHKYKRKFEVFNDLKLYPISIVNISCFCVLFILYV